MSRPSLAFSGALASRGSRRQNAGGPGAGSADPGDHRVQTMPTASSAAKFPMFFGSLKTMFLRANVIYNNEIFIDILLMCIIYNII